MPRYLDYIRNHISYLVCTFIFVLPIFFFDVNDYEEYNQGIYSAKYLFSSLNNFFSNYNFDLGLGTFMPLGQGLFFYPTSILSFDLKLFTLSTILLNIFIQYYFFLRISKIFNIYSNFKYNFLLNILLIINLTNLVFNYFDDWISGHTLYSIFFALIFYLIKFSKKQTPNSLNKMTLFFLLAFINGHLGYLVCFILFFSIFVLINIRNFQINKTRIILPLLVCLIICLPRILELFSIYLTYPELDQEDISLENVIYTLIYPINFILRIFDSFFNLSLSNKEVFFHSKALGYGPQLLFGLLISIFIILKNKSKEILNFDKIYLLGFSLIIISNFITIGNYSIFIRDFMNIIFLIILLFFLNQKVYKKMSHFCFAILLVSNMLMFVDSFRILKSKDINHKIKNSKNQYSPDLKYYLNSISGQEQKFFRLYLSEKVYSDILHRRNAYYKLNNIFTPKDFTKFNFSTFNVHLKNHVNTNLRNPMLRMHNQILPINSEIENNFLMNFYQIKYLLIYDKEATKIDLSNFKEIKKFFFDNKKLLLFKNLNFGTQYIIKNEKNLKACENNLLSFCLTREQKSFEKNSKIIISKVKKNNIEIKNLNDENVSIILPFFKNNFWEIKNHNLIFDQFTKISIKSNEKITIENKSILFIIYKVIMIFVMISFIYYIYVYRKKYKDL